MCMKMKEILPIEADDEEAMDVLTSWLAENADILPSLTRRYGKFIRI